MRKLLVCLTCLCLLLGIAAPAISAEPDALVIQTKEDFLAFAEHCRLDSYSKGLTVSLAADLDLSDTAFVGIPIFCGTFNGNGHTLSGVTLTAAGSQQGMFRYLTATATVRDLRLSATVAPDGSGIEIGGIVGNNAGIVENCLFSGSVSGISRVGGIAGFNTVSGVVKDCTVLGTVHGVHFVGGVVGENAGVIRDCANTAAVNTTPEQNQVDLSDIRLETLTTTESLTTVTDIGGIAGSNNGTLRGCRNNGDVGYRHIGYNVGGIVGSHIGYLIDCENFGDVSGRKEVGGIVGQMEPSILLRYQTDTIRRLRTEMAVLNGHIGHASENLQTHILSIRQLMNELERHAENGEAALEILRLSADDPTLRDPDTYASALQSLGSSLVGISRTVRSLSEALKTTDAALSEDLQTISRQMDVINAILDRGEDSLGATVNDVSDADTAADRTAKLEQTANYGIVLGDLNVGGIVGAIAPENDLDPEQDVTVSGSTSLHVSQEWRCVVLRSFNHTAVTAKRQNCGGVVGRQTLGLVKECSNVGTVHGDTYVGGIIGQSDGFLRDCYAKCIVEGSSHCGGIAGSGTVVSGCRSMVKISGNERVGAVLGTATDPASAISTPLRDNVYVCIGKDVGAVDGISYAAAAEPLTREEFLALAQLPELFRTVRLTFVFEDGTTKIVTQTPGEALDLASVPTLPSKDGFVGVWNGLAELDRAAIEFDHTFHAAYTAYSTTIASTAAQGNKPCLLLQGSFAPNAAVTLTEASEKPPLSHGDTLLACHGVQLTNADTVTAARFLFTGSTQQLRVYVYDGKRWQAVTHTVDGSYLVFPLTAEHRAFAVVQPRNLRWLFAVVGGVALLLLIGVLVLIRQLRKRKKSA